MRELLELFTNTINHLLKIYLGKITQCVSIMIIYHRNNGSFANEIYKIKNASTPTMSEIFKKRNLNYSLCSQTDFSLPSANTGAYGLKSLKYFTEKVWSIVPFEIRNTISLEEVSAKIIVL